MRSGSSPPVNGIADTTNYTSLSSRLDFAERNLGLRIDVSGCVDVERMNEVPIFILFLRTFCSGIFKVACKKFYNFSAPYVK